MLPFWKQNDLTLIRIILKLIIIVIMLFLKYGWVIGSFGITEKISPMVYPSYTKQSIPILEICTQNEDSATGSWYMESYRILFNELQTKEPYGWKLIMKQDYASMEKTQIESKMKSYASALISVIDNLDYVTFEYTVDGEKHLLTFTEQDADKLAGHSVKNLAETPRGLQELMKF